MPVILLQFCQQALSFGKIICREKYYLGQSEICAIKRQHRNRTTLDSDCKQNASVANCPNLKSNLMTFLETTYHAAATTGLWDKEKFAFSYQ